MILRIDSDSLMSQAVIHNGIVYVCGIVAEDLSQDFKDQTRQILKNIDYYLEKAGSNKSLILNANIWLTDIKNWDSFNKIWEEWIPPQTTPARATVEAKLALPDAQIEIMLQAAVAHFG